MTCSVKQGSSNSTVVRTLVTCSNYIYLENTLEHKLCTFQNTHWAHGFTSTPFSSIHCSSWAQLNMSHTLHAHLPQMDSGIDSRTQGWVCCCLSTCTLLWEVFLWKLWFFPLLTFPNFNPELHWHPWTSSWSSMGIQIIICIFFLIWF